MQPSENLKNKTILITGASDGIGKETARQLAGLGASLLLLGHSPEKLMSSVNEIIALTGNQKVSGLQADLSESSEVERVAVELHKQTRHIDVLMNNAGAAFLFRQENSCGIEKTFALNHLAYFQLTGLLLDLLKKSPEPRIVNVASSAHAKGKIHFDDLNLKNSYSMMKAYQQSKHANVLFTYMLAEKLYKVGFTVNALHPGFVRTNIGQQQLVWGKKIVEKIIFRKAIPVEQGALTPIYLCASPEVSGITGKYFVNKAARKTVNHSYDKKAQERLWELSENLTGVYY